MGITLSELPVAFQGGGAGVGELTWGQAGVWRTTRRTGRTMNIVLVMPLPEGTPVAEMAAVLRFIVSRHPALRTRLRFVDGPSGVRRLQQVVSASGEVALQIADIDEGDDPAAVAEEMRSRYELTGFDYENEFPVRMGIVRQAGVLVHLVLGYSHVMVDGVGIGVLTRDLDHLDRITGEAQATFDGPSPLDLARTQAGPVGRRQSERSIHYCAAQLARLEDWSPSEQPSLREPRFWELVGYSPAMELGMRAVAARTGVATTYVLLAAYASAVASVFGRDPSIAQIVVSNRFRPGLAEAVSQISQHGICVVDTAHATFDEVVLRAYNAATNACFYGYYDPADHAAMLAREKASRGGLPLEISWHLNDRRGLSGPDDGSVVSGNGSDASGDVSGDDVGAESIEAELAMLLPKTRMYWDRRQAMFDGALFLQIDSEPLLAARRNLMEGLPAVYLEVWVDTHRFALSQVEALVREMEAVVVRAVLGERVSG